MTQNTKNLIEINQVSFKYGDRVIYDNISTSIPKGKITVILGPSGSGKSTMLKLVGGNVVADNGDVLFDGQNIAKLSRKQLFAMRKRMGMMFQQNALLTDLSVLDNVAYPLREHTDLDESLIHRLALIKLEMVGLRGTHAMMPDELSGGMARRVALARAMSLEPDLIMYDEPFTGLDPIAKGAALKLIRELNTALQCTSIVVTHDINEGFEIADHVCLIGDGRVLEEGPPEKIKDSDNSAVRQFIEGLPDGPVPFHYPTVELADELLK